MSGARVVIWLSQTAGKGFAMKTVALAGAAAVTLIGGISCKTGQWLERKKMKNKIDKKAQEVFEIIKRKEYKNAQKLAEMDTMLYTPEHGLELLKRDNNVVNKNGCKIFVTEETTQVAAHRLVVDEKVNDLVLLNFASGKNPGGGFLKGSKSQEEDLCRCSGLYNCLAGSAPSYYAYNRERKDPLYSDHVMYSPKVPWFRKNSKEKPGDMFLASVITSPAPNAREYLRVNNNGQAEIEKVLKQRAKIILAVAQQNGHRNLLLGAWGCGVFANSPTTVANTFGKLLQSGGFAKAFDTVTFAIYCVTKNDEETVKIFKEQFTK